MLVEQGRLALADPVQKYLPEFKDVQVGEEKPDKTLELVGYRDSKALYRAWVAKHELPPRQWRLQHQHG